MERSRVQPPAPKLSICLLAVGSIADIQPFLSIAIKLQQDGHNVRLATHDAHRGLVVKHGIPFYPLAGSPAEMEVARAQSSGYLTPMPLGSTGATFYKPDKSSSKRRRKLVDAILRSTWPAVSAEDIETLEPFRAQLIVSSPEAFGHIHVAEKLGVPLHLFSVQPSVPTSAFPHPISNRRQDVASADQPSTLAASSYSTISGNSSPESRKASNTDVLVGESASSSRTNYLSYKFIDLLLWQGLRSLVNRFRTEELGLDEVPRGDFGRKMLQVLQVPQSFMWSTLLALQPTDWAPYQEVVGVIAPVAKGDDILEAYEEQAPDQLVSFLDTHEPPILVDFSAIHVKHPESTIKMVVDAATEINNLPLVISLSTSTSISGHHPDHVCVVYLTDAQRTWLLSKVSGVVHPGLGAESCACLVAGKPEFTVPLMGDQPFWGCAIAKAGAGVTPTAFSKLTAKRLAQAFDRLTSSTIQATAEALSDELQMEGSIHHAVKSVYHHLPLDRMYCDNGCRRVATRWSPNDKRKLCDTCEETEATRKGRRRQDVQPCRYVDYASPTSVTSTWKGVAVGTGALFQEIGGGVKDLVMMPAHGYRDEGLKGATSGLVKGVGEFFKRPVKGVAIMKGSIESGHRAGKNKSAVVVVKEEKKKLTSKNAARRSDSSDDLMFTSIDPAPSSKQREAMQMTYLSLLTGESSQEQSRGFQSVYAMGSYAESESESSVSEKSFFDPDVAPHMSICMIATGGWEENVQQFVAVGKRLQQDGHRVRVAAHGDCRYQVLKAGLEFYPLGGGANTIFEFAYYVGLKRLRKNRVGSSSGPELLKGTQYHDLASMKALIESLWPACVAPDPLDPTQPFMADAIISHPLLYGQTLVAERLGVPMHCMGGFPLTRTKAFPHLMSSDLPQTKLYANSKSYAETYDLMNEMALGEIIPLLDSFRQSLSLQGRCNYDHLLDKWNVPHSYLYPEVLLPPPSDWDENIVVAGYADLPETIEADEEEMVSEEEGRMLEFVERQPEQSVIYVGFQRGEWIAKDVGAFLQTLDQAASASQVQVILQLFGEKDGDSPQGQSGASVLQVRPTLDVRRILPFVHAALQPGDIATTSRCLKAGKPICIVPITPRERFWGFATIHSGAGVGMLERRQLLSAEMLSHAFEQLLDPERVVKAAQVGEKISTSEAVDAAAASFYAALPVSAMRCDVDPTRVARFYDPVNRIKMSGAATAAVNELDGQESKLLPYQPLVYSQDELPALMLDKISELEKASEKPAAEKRIVPPSPSPSPTSRPGTFGFFGAMKAM